MEIEKLIPDYTETLSKYISLPVQNLVGCIKEYNQVAIRCITTRKDKKIRPNIDDLFLYLDAVSVIKDILTKLTINNKPPVDRLKQAKQEIEKSIKTFYVTGKFKDEKDKKRIKQMSEERILIKKYINIIAKNKKK